MLEEYLKSVGREEIDEAELTVQRFAQDLIDFDVGLHPKQYLVCNFRNCFILNSSDGTASLLW